MPKSGKYPCEILILKNSSSDKWKVIGRYSGSKGPAHAAEKWANKNHGAGVHKVYTLKRRIETGKQKDFHKHITAYNVKVIKLSEPLVVERPNGIKYTVSKRSKIEGAKQHIKFDKDDIVY